MCHRYGGGSFPCWRRRRAGVCHTGYYSPPQKHVVGVIAIRRPAESPSQMSQLYTKVLEFPSSSKPRVTEFRGRFPMTTEANGRPPCTVSPVTSPSTEWVHCNNCHRWCHQTAGPTLRLKLGCVAGPVYCTTSITGCRHQFWKFRGVNLRPGGLACFLPRFGSSSGSPSWAASRRVASQSSPSRGCVPSTASVIESMKGSCLGILTVINKASLPQLM